MKELSQELREIFDEKWAQKYGYFCQRPMQDFLYDTGILTHPKIAEDYISQL